MDALETVCGMEDVDADLNMLCRLKSLWVTVCVDGEKEEGVLEVESGGFEGEKPNMPSKGLRRLVSLRVMGGGS